MSRPQSPAQPASPALSDDAAPEAPLTMAASTLLTTLPVDAKEALVNDGKVRVQKVRIHLVAIGSAPRMPTMVFMMTASNRFEVVVRQIRNKLKLKPHESVFCYLGNVFSPGLDESVENLWRCFKQGQKEELYVGYALSPAFG
ncbi:hypothetical protein PMIN06_001999 [Paraphaeosphaeria minitans]|uniref:Ubiquitin-like protein ATG12 n=1 Tax=Paraphaeosphaeria minitans TaxID=565426 RepID=A0A9P6KWE4_9PLEO|nr:Ubiquitin-like protein atg12 [Paraphaeosphaeria minitans]